MKEKAINADNYNRPLKPGETTWIQELGLLEADKARLTSGRWLNCSDQYCPEVVEEEVSQSGWAPGHSGQGDSWKASSGRLCTDSECGEVPLADRKQQVLSSR